MSSSWLLSSLWFLFVVVLQLLLTDYVADAYGPRGRCPNPRPYFQNGIPKLRHRGRVVKYVCLPGFVLVGSDIATCYSGHWDRPMPFCAAPGCAMPPASAFRYGTIANVQNSSMVLQFHCRPGYALSGAQTTFCNGRAWNATLPRCTPMELNPPTSCDFESPDYCSWNLDLERQTQFRRDYVQKDHTFGGVGTQIGHVMSLVNATGHATNTTIPKLPGRMVSPVFRSIDTPGCFSMWYRLPCTGCELRLLLWQEADMKLLWSTKGPDTTDWVQAQVPVPSLFQDFQIVIEGVPGNTMDISVDDVSLHPKSQECLPVAATTTVFSTDKEVDTTEDISVLESTTEVASTSTTAPPTTSPITSPVPTSVSTRPPSITIYVFKPVTTTQSPTTSSTSVTTPAIITTQTTSTLSTRARPIFILPTRTANATTVPPTTQTTRLTNNVTTMSATTSAPTTVKLTIPPSTAVRFIYTPRPTTTRRPITSTATRLIIPTSLRTTPTSRSTTTTRTTSTTRSTTTTTTPATTTRSKTTTTTTTTRPTTRPTITTQPTTMRKIIFLPTKLPEATSRKPVFLITTVERRTPTTTRPTSTMVFTRRPGLRPRTTRFTTEVPTITTPKYTTITIRPGLRPRTTTLSTRRPGLRPRTTTLSTRRPVYTRRTTIQTTTRRPQRTTTLHPELYPTRSATALPTIRATTRPAVITTGSPTSKTTVRVKVTTQELGTRQPVTSKRPASTTRRITTSTERTRQKSTPSTRITESVTRGHAPSTIATSGTTTDIPNELHPIFQYTSGKQGSSAGLKGGIIFVDVVGEVIGGLLAAALLVVLLVFVAYKLRARARQRRSEESEMRPLSECEVVDPSFGL